MNEVASNRWRWTSALHPTRWHVVGLPVLLAAVVRVVYWAFVIPEWMPTSDADQYLRIARALAGGDGDSLVYPQLVMRDSVQAAVVSGTLAIPNLFSDTALWPSRLLSLIISLGVVALTGLFVRRLAGDIAGMAAGVAVAIMPFLVGTTVTSEPGAPAVRRDPDHD